MSVIKGRRRRLRTHTRGWSLADAPCARLNISVNSTAITIGDHDAMMLSNVITA